MSRRIFFHTPGYSPSCASAAADLYKLWLQVLVLTIANLVVAGRYYPLLHQPLDQVRCLTALPGIKQLATVIYSYTHLCPLLEVTHLRENGNGTQLRPVLYLLNARLNRKLSARKRQLWCTVMRVISLNYLVFVYQAILHNEIEFIFIKDQIDVLRRIAFP